MLRTASWLIYGARWFTASGYERSAQGFDSRDDQVMLVLLVRAPTIKSVPETDCEKCSRTSWRICTSTSIKKAAIPGGALKSN